MLHNAVNSEYKLRCLRLLITGVKGYDGVSQFLGSG